MQTIGKLIKDLSWHNGFTIKCYKKGNYSYPVYERYIWNYRTVEDVKVISWRLNGANIFCKGELEIHVLDDDYNENIKVVKYV